jgi:hypothetical protein
MSTPRFTISHAPQAWAVSRDWVTWSWDPVPSLPALVLAGGGGPAQQQTVIRVCGDAEALYVRFDCDDRDIWGTYTQRDEPIYDEEVVELFIAAGEEDPVRYFEFEVSPNGVLFDAHVYNPASDRRDLVVDVAWDCPGIRWHAQRDDAANRWCAALSIPWASINPAGPPPAIWRANFYRIERPRDAAPEFSCWSPTMTDPADFHKPARFGTLELART